MLPSEKADALAKVRAQLRAAVGAGKMTQDRMNERFLKFACDFDFPGSHDSADDKKLLKRLNRSADHAVKRMAKTFDDNKGCRYPYLEQMMVRSLSEVADNVQLDTTFAKMIACVCMKRIVAVQPDYRTIYKVKREIPSDTWIAKVLQDSQFRRLQIYGDGRLAKYAGSVDDPVIIDDREGQEVDDQVTDENGSFKVPTAEAICEAGINSVLRTVETCSWDKFWGTIRVPAVDAKGELLRDASGRHFSAKVGGVDRILYFTKRKQRQKASTEYQEMVEAACERSCTNRMKRKYFHRVRMEKPGAGRGLQPVVGHPEVAGTTDFSE